MVLLCLVIASGLPLGLPSLPSTFMQQNLLLASIDHTFFPRSFTLCLFVFFNFPTSFFPDDYYFIFVCVISTYYWILQQVCSLTCIFMVLILFGFFAFSFYISLSLDDFILTDTHLVKAGTNTRKPQSLDVFSIRGENSQSASIYFVSNYMFQMERLGLCTLPPLSSLLTVQTALCIWIGYVPTWKQTEYRNWLINRVVRKE